MRTLVELRAVRRPDGTTRLQRAQATGALAARATGADTVHLVATAAGPLGGDVCDIAVHVGAGALLRLRSVAAAVALPGPAGAPRASVLTVDATVEQDGELDIDLEPTVVAAGAEHHSSLSVTLGPGARLRHREQVVLGRHGERAGTWVGGCAVTRAGLVVLRHRLSLGPGTAGWDALCRPRAGVFMVTCDPRDPCRTATTAASATGYVVCTPLPDGSRVMTALGASPADLHECCARLPGPPAPAGAR